MKTRDLALELDAAIAATTDEYRRRLVALGVAAGLLAPPLAMVGLARVRVSGDLYEPDDHSGTAFVTPVLIANPGSPEAADPETRPLRRRLGRPGGLAARSA